MRGFFVNFMKPSIAVLVLSAPETSSSRQALAFCQEVLAQGYRLEAVFFYHQSTQLANSLAISAQGQSDIYQNWQDFIERHDINAHVCIASSLTRGIINQEEAERYQKPGVNLHPAFEVSGLGAWVEACNNAERHITFGG